jgi:hypothetical protein
MTHINQRFEIRTCIKCGEEKEIKQRHIHANNICADCGKARSKEYQREASIKAGKGTIVGRKPYPGGFDSGARNKFYRLKTELDKCKHREEWIPILARNLDVTLNDVEIMTWIKTEKEDEPKPKKPNNIKRDYPDTRGMTWEEYQKGLGEDDVDS